MESSMEKEGLEGSLNAGHISSEASELCCFIEQLLEKHHTRIMGELEVLLGGMRSGPLYNNIERGSFSSSPLTPRWSATEPPQQTNNNTQRPSYGTMQADMKRSAGEVRFKTRLSARRRQMQNPGRWRNFVKSTAFELLSCCLIVANAIFFGVEAELAVARRDDPGLSHAFWVIGQVFTAVFALEIVLRIAVDVKGFFARGSYLWNLFDVGVVVAGLLELAFSFAGVETQTNLTHVRVIRVARMVRMLKVVRLLAALASLRILVNSVLNTMRSLLWTLALLFVVLYLFGLLFTNATLEFFTRDGTPVGPPEELELLDIHFGGLFRSIYTLFQAITNGVSWGAVARPLGLVHPAWEVTFSAFISFTFFAMLNVVTGVFCQSAIESANQDRDSVVQAQMQMEKLYTEQLQRIFNQIDEENTGYITLRMFEESLQDDEVKAYFDGLDLTNDDAWNLFRLLDANESNCIDLGEFVAGCLRLRGRARSVDVHMLLHQSQWTMKRLGDVLVQLKEGKDAPKAPRRQPTQPTTSPRRGSEPEAEALSRLDRATSPHRATSPRRSVQSAFRSL